MILKSIWTLILDKIYNLLFAEQTVTKVVLIFWRVVYKHLLNPVGIYNDIKDRQELFSRSTIDDSYGLISRPVSTKKEKQLP